MTPAADLLSGPRDVDLPMDRTCDAAARVDILSQNMCDKHRDTEKWVPLAA